LSPSAAVELAPVCNDFAVRFIPAEMSHRDLVKQLIASEQISEGPFHVVDLGAVVRQLRQWARLLPRVTPFYAIKCNPEPAIVRTLAALGCGFDCASKAEIEQVLSYGVAPERVLLANPCKMPSHIKAARAMNVCRMTFDNADELAKIHRDFPCAEIILRILPDDSHSVMKFGSKFGAPPSTWAPLFAKARALSLNIVGVSFHVGSGCMSPAGFTKTLQLARDCFDVGLAAGFDLKLLDVGGGFPGGDERTVCFADIANAMRVTIDKLFDASVQVIAEPGRYFAQQSQVLAASVYARREIDPLAHEVPNASSNLRYLYYINDGVYDSFNCIFFDHAHPVPEVLEQPRPDAVLHVSNMFGPTCDSMDLIVKDMPLPELAIGDWLYFPHMGAYTSAAGSAFNGFRNKTRFYVFSC
jgi:ornithine decarboxylase